MPDLAIWVRALLSATLTVCLHIGVFGFSRIIVLGCRQDMIYNVDPPLLIQIIIFQLLMTVEGQLLGAFYDHLIYFMMCVAFQEQSAVLVSAILKFKTWNACLRSPKFILQWFRTLLTPSTKIV